MKITSSFVADEFEWLNPPESILSGEEAGGGGMFEVADQTLVLTPPAFRDFWSQTYYSPPLIKSDATGYLHHIPHPCQEEVTVKVDFTYTPVNQFDQAGILLFINSKHWMKCGIEFCDGQARLSVVVCNDYSDWSTQLWTNSLGVRLKVHTVKQANSIVIEAAPLNTEDYQFIRIARLDANEDAGSWRVGPFAACTFQQRGCTATFSNIYVGPREAAAHNPNLESH